MKSFVKFYAPAPPSPPELRVPVKEQPKLIRVLDDIQALFGKGGVNWIQGAEKVAREVNDKTFDAFCLVGALKEIDGPYEDAARAAISLAILERDVLEPDNENDPFEPVENALSDTEDTIIDFNDAGDRTWAEILKVLKRARALVQGAKLKLKIAGE